MHAYMQFVPLIRGQMNQFIFTEYIYWLYVSWSLHGMQ